MHLERRQWTGFAENQVHGSLVVTRSTKHTACSDLILLQASSAATSSKRHGRRAAFTSTRSALLLASNCRILQI